jgi:hypothetical protein
MTSDKVRIKDLKGFALYPAFIRLYQRPTMVKPWLFCSWLLEKPHKKSSQSAAFSVTQTRMNEPLVDHDITMLRSNLGDLQHVFNLVGITV